MDRYLYLAINLCSVSVPLLASFYRRHPFYKKWAPYFMANAIVAALFIGWDMVFTAMGVWGFNDRYLTGITLVNLPIEEVLFFFCIPYSAVFVYFSLQYLIRKNPLRPFQGRITISLAVLLAVTGAGYWGRCYTSATFIATSLYLFYNYWRKADLADIYLSYMVTLIFFFIVNGLLTGSWIDEPVVWYDNSENLGLRMGTIPVEDIFYGFLLIAATIQIFEFLKARAQKLG